MKKILILMVFALCTGIALGQQLITENDISSESATRNGDSFTIGDIEMVFVEGRGSVSGFYIGKYEVTQRQWLIVMETTIEQQNDKSDFKGLYGVGDDYPMYQVSWDDAQEFVQKLNATTDGSFRLPTEAEWEYAAKGGADKKSYTYAGSNNVDEVAWYKNNSGRGRSGRSHSVGGKKANSIGIYDMNGNVWEWTSTVKNSSHVIRGGGWSSTAGHCTIAYRSTVAPGTRDCIFGFRVACSSK
jgi:formylglycine-generating enzyme required for sulfatase activity